MDEIRKERRRPTYRGRRRRIAAVLLPAALLGVAATTYALLQADEVVAAGIGCYDRPNTDGDVTIVSTTGDSPESVCGELWAQGAVKEGVTEVPELVPCVNEPGAVLVFPSEDPDLCAQLGFHKLPKGYEAAAKRFVEMRNDLIAELYREATAGGVSERDACLDEDTALRIARSVLREHGFSDWEAAVATGDYRGRTCANVVAFEDAEKTVLVIPSEPGVDPNPFGPH